MTTFHNLVLEIELVWFISFYQLKISMHACMHACLTFPNISYLFQDSKISNF